MPETVAGGAQPRETSPAKLRHTGAASRAGVTTIPLITGSSTGMKIMAERLVDVSRSNGIVLHTFPITLESSGVIPEDAEYATKALKAAAHAQLVPDESLAGLTAKMHVDRSGQLEPYGDDHAVLAQTKQGLDQVVRERAYLLWEHEGCPDGRSEEFWHRAHEAHLRARAYVLWQQEGCPAGQADEHWHRTQEFELH